MELVFVLKTQCPYCGGNNLKKIGIQKGIKADLVLANCMNSKCDQYTLVVAKIYKGKAA